MNVKIHCQQLSATELVSHLLLVTENVIDYLVSDVRPFVTRPLEHCDLLIGVQSTFLQYPQISMFWFIKRGTIHPNPTNQCRGQPPWSNMGNTTKRSSSRVAVDVALLHKKASRRSTCNNVGNFEASHRIHSSKSWGEEKWSTNGNGSLSSEVRRNSAIWCWVFPESMAWKMN